MSGGSKNYAYLVRVHLCKVKGINLNYKNDKKINFKKIKEMVLGPVPAQVVVDGTRICRTKKEDVITRPEKKTYRLVFTRRRE